MIMVSSRTILRNLRNLKDYLTLFLPSEQPTYFEKLIAETFSNILYLPFYTSDNDDPNIPHRLTWQGSINSISKAPQGKPDAIAYCYNYYLIIEATLKTGASQCSKEYASSIRHCEDFCNQNGISQKDAFVLIICNELHRDTYRTIKNNFGEEKSKFIPIKVSELEKILQTSILVFTLRHLELWKLFHKISDCIRDSSSLITFSKSVDSSITEWQKEVFKLEKNAFIGLKSYEVMRKIRRTYISTSDILQKLQRHTTVNQYFKIIGEKVKIVNIENGLVQQNFASRLTTTFDGEELFEPIPYLDFKERGLRLINAVMRIK
jgi:hypothetical protein